MSIVFVTLVMPFVICAAQTTHNLDIIWQRGTPDTSLYLWGAAISGVGDVNGDGYDDVAVGCFKTTGALETDTAYVYIYYGGAAGIDTIHDLLIKDWAKGWNGLSICGGNINKDGYSDIVINPTSSGKAYIHYGGSSPSPTADISFGGRLYETFTTVVCGDVNGDDTTDLIVGDYANLSGNGHVNIYKGSAAFDTIPWVEIKGHGGEEFGYSISASGDVNTDGYNDLAVGAINYGADGRGRLYIFYGGAPMDTVPDMWKDGEGPSQSWGWMNVAVLPNGQGYGKTGIGCCLWPNGFMSENRGKALIFNGGADIDSFPDAVMLGKSDSSYLGYWNAWVGDMDTNKYGDWGSIASADSLALLWRCNETTDTLADAWLKYLKPGLLTNAGDVNKDDREEVMFASNADTNRIVVICKYTGPNGVEGIPVNDNQLTMNFVLQNSPNPFGQRTKIKYQISKSGIVSLKVFNIAGQLVRVLVDEIKKSGSYEDYWDGVDGDGRKATNGIYIYQLKHEGVCLSKKMVLIR